MKCIKNTGKLFLRDSLDLVDTALLVLDVIVLV